MTHLGLLPSTSRPVEWLQHDTDRRPIPGRMPKIKDHQAATPFEKSIHAKGSQTLSEAKHPFPPNHPGHGSFAKGLGIRLTIP